MAPFFFVAVNPAPVFPPWMVTANAKRVKLSPKSKISLQKHSLLCKDNAAGENVWDLSNYVYFSKFAYPLFETWSKGRMFQALLPNILQVKQNLKKITCRFATARFSVPYPGIWPSLWSRLLALCRPRPNHTQPLASPASDHCDAYAKQASVAELGNALDFASLGHWKPQYQKCCLMPLMPLPIGKRWDGSSTHNSRMKNSCALEHIRGRLAGSKLMMLACTSSIAPANIFCPRSSS